MVLFRPVKPPTFTVANTLARRMAGQSAALLRMTPSFRPTQPPAYSEQFS